MPEEYIENLIITHNGTEELLEPTFPDDDCDAEFEFKATLRLTRIVKKVQNATHNKHTYCFEVVSIDEIKKQEGN